MRLTVWALVVIAGLAGFFIKNAAYFRRGAPSVSARFDYWQAAVRTGDPELYKAYADAVNQRAPSALRDFCARR